MYIPKEGEKKKTLVFPKPILYTNNKILIGNWYDDRGTFRKYVQVPSYETTHRAHYIELPVQMHGLKDVWLGRIRNEGVDDNEMFDLDGKSFFANYATTYDLSYNPEYKNLTIPKDRHYSYTERTIIPQADLCKEYGNLTNFGLRKALEPIWEYERKITISSTLPLTTNQEEFTAPKPEDYAVTRYILPRMANEITPHPTEMIETVQRGKLVCKPGKPIICNTITHECPWKSEQCTRTN